MDSHGFSMLGPIAGLHIEREADFPAEPPIGRFVFTQKRVWFCTEVEAGIPAYIPMTSEITYKKHIMAALATEVVFKHDLNCPLPIVQCYDEQGRWIMPRSVTARDADTVVVSFAVATKAVIVVLTGNEVGAPSPRYAFEYAFTNEKDLVIQHMLGRHPDVAVWTYDDTGTMSLIRAPVTYTDNNTVAIALSKASSGVVYFQ